MHYRFFQRKISDTRVVHVCEEDYFDLAREHALRYHKRKHVIFTGVELPR